MPASAPAAAPASERAISEVLRAGAPSVPVVGEEEGGAHADRFWSVDPLDGGVARRDPARPADAEQASRLAGERARRGAE